MVRCGLAAALAGVPASLSPALKPDSGFWLEQTLYQSLQSWRALDPLHRRIHTWRERCGREVDFLLEDRGRLVALEIKSGGVVKTDDTAGLRAFRDSLRDQGTLMRSVVLHPGSPRPLGDNILALPWGWLVPSHGNEKP